MKFTLSWLKDHLDTQASLGEIVETLTRIARVPSEVVVPEKSEVPSFAISAMTASFHSAESSPVGSVNATTP